MAIIEVDVKDVTSFRPVILSMMRKLRIPSKDREDFEQDCYVKILENVGKISGAKDPKLYVFELCKNLRIDKQRGEESEYKTLSLSVGEVEHAANKIPFVSSEFYEQYGITDERLYEALSQLTPKSRDALTAYYFTERGQLKTVYERFGSRERLLTAVKKANKELKGLLENL